MGANRLSFAAGLAIGFVAGTRAGRERYDQMVKAAKTAKESPAFQQAAGAVQAQASGLISSAGQKAPRLAQSAMHSVSDHVPLLKNRNSDSAGNGEAGKGSTVSASGNGQSGTGDS
jgi:hypothetical protein